MVFDSEKELSPEDSFKVLEELELNQPKDVMEIRCIDEVEVKAPAGLLHWALVEIT